LEADRLSFKALRFLNEYPHCHIKLFCKVAIGSAELVAVNGPAVQQLYQILDSEVILAVTLIFFLRTHFPVAPFA
jgi:hypothetical protein